MSTMLVDEDPSQPPPTYPPRCCLSTPPYLGRMVLARVFFAGYGASTPRDVEASMMHHIAQQKSRPGMKPRLHGLRAANTRNDKKPTHIPHAHEFSQLPTTLYMYRRRLATSTRPNIGRRSPGGVLGEEGHVHSTVLLSVSVQAQGRCNAIRTHRLTGRINSRFSAQAGVYVQPCS